MKWSDKENEKTMQISGDVSFVPNRDPVLSVIGQISNSGETLPLYEFYSFRLLGTKSVMKLAMGTLLKSTSAAWRIHSPSSP